MHKPVEYWEYLILIAIFSFAFGNNVAANASEPDSITSRNEPHFAPHLLEGSDFSSLTYYFRESWNDTNVQCQAILAL